MKTLFDETRINSMVLKNRLIRSAVWENMSDENGRPTEQLLTFYRELARGGVGTIITGCTFVMPGDQFYPGMTGIWEDGLIDDHKRLTAEVHDQGCAIVQQLAFGGPQGARDDRELPVWGPSHVADLATQRVPTPMEAADIHALAEAFAAAAVRARAAGYDGVQLHGAHGYLLGQFLSPHYNRREDEYGGGIENRSRIYMEIYKAVRRGVGEAFPIWLKINSADYIDNGSTPEDCLYVCKTLAGLGLDAVEISGGTAASSHFMSRAKINAPEKEAYHADAAARMAENLKIPVILVGGIRSPAVMEKLLATTAIDYFSMARPLLAEPDLPNRWRSGEGRRARCISCNGCFREDGTGNTCAHREKFKASAAGQRTR